MMKLNYACKFPNCKNGYYSNAPPSHKNKHFYSFPTKKRPTLLHKWKEICNIKDEVFCDNFYVCEDHFLPKDFVNETRHRINYSVIPKYIISADQEDRGILSDHSYVKLPSESSASPNLVDERNSHIDAENDPLDCDSNRNRSCDTLVMNDVYQRLSVADKLFCKSFAQFKVNHLDLKINTGAVSSRKLNMDNNVNLKTLIVPSVDIKNVDFDFNSLCNDSRYDFLSSPFDDTVSSEEGDALDKSRILSSNMHTNIILRIEKFKELLENEKEYLKVIFTLFKNGTFIVINENLGHITDNLIKIVDNCINKKAHNKNWTTQDKTISLYLYKHGSRLYKYLLLYFELPPINLLKVLFSKINVDTGLDPISMAVLSRKVRDMNLLDKYCTLLFDKMPLDQGFHYEPNTQKICGYQDFGHLGRLHMLAKHVLVFMIRGIHTSWQQVVAYYFIGYTISREYLKMLIIEIISQMQNIGLNIVATVCDQSPCFQKTLKELCEQRLEPSPFYFLVNNQPVVTIFNAPHLLRNTRNVFIDYNIQLDENAVAKFEFIKKLFVMDTKKKIQTLPKLKKEDFIHKDVKVKTAAAQLSNTVAAGIETLVITNFLPQEAMCTAEFVSIVDNLFDSLNGHDINEDGDKKYRCSLTDNSPHVDFWSQQLVQLDSWKVIDPQTGNEQTDNRSFVEGWQLTIGSVMFLWKHIKKVGFKELHLRKLNAEPLENLFYCIRQYSTKTNPTCFQFIEALKTCMVNNYSLPFQTNDLAPLCNLTHFWIENINSFQNSNSESIMSDLPENFLGRHIDAQYIIEYMLNAIDFDEKCVTCVKTLFTPDATGKSCLISLSLMEYLNTINNKLYKSLQQYSYMDLLLDRFKSALQLTHHTMRFCDKHPIEISILDTVVPLLIYRYVNENNITLEIIYEKRTMV